MHPRLFNPQKRQAGQYLEQTSTKLHEELKSTNLNSQDHATKASAKKFHSIDRLCSPRLDILLEVLLKLSVRPGLDRRCRVSCRVMPKAAVQFYGNVRNT